MRLKRLFPSNRSGLFAVPMDHSLTMGPIPGIERLGPMVQKLQSGGVTAIIVHKGAVRDIQDVLDPSTSLGIHLSSSTTQSPEPHRKFLSGRVHDAVRLGADFVSLQVNFGVPGEGEMLADLGEIVDQAAALGIPVLCMAYVKRKGQEYDPDSLAHACRAAADLGADVVKTSFPSLEGFKRIVGSVSVPVLVGGGQKLENKADLLRLVEQSMGAGGAGICIGRNLFQQDDVIGVCNEVRRILAMRRERSA